MGKYSFVDNEENQIMGHDTKEVALFESYASMKAKVNYL